MEVGEKRSMIFKLRQVMVRLGDISRVDEEVTNGESNRQLLEKLREMSQASTGNQHDNDAHPVEAS